MFYPDHISALIERLTDNGYEAFIVGGSLRDTMLGRTPNDFDIATSALPEQTLSVFKDLRTIPTGLKHGTVTVISEGEPVEITTFRVDGEYKDSRHPDSVSFTSNITEDLSRRDFTVNAMAYNKKCGLVDPFGGREDLDRGIIRAVGEPERRFDEDALRIMRAFRFSAQLGFKIEPSTLAAAEKKREGLANIARERISAEFLRLICSKAPSEAIELMIETKTLQYVLGEYTPTRRILAGLKNTAAEPKTRLGIILCDASDEEREIILKGLRLSSKLYSAANTIAREAGKCLCGSDRDARVFIGNCGEHISSVLDAAKAVGSLDPLFAEKVELNLSKKVCTTQSKLAVTGSDLIALGIKGKQIGETMSLLLERVLDDPNANTSDTLISIAKQANNIS